ncbi:helix-turn-helix domain-containing protein [Microbacterium azadirachtae]|uniref:ArsR/SmtB family transcription factor n=1 Tax=Microbacterium azadirachtae TaxID=582680 RepID=UPI0021D4BB7F|nr:helix-turn-helix domain-containing protein [Microbacterium azadirachtae]UXW85325.1 helix-turn-helix domain-containing protein [Microbacterium azadirachtae]
MEGVEWEHHRVDFHLSPGDIQAVRFGISPGHELAHAVRVLLRPEQYPLAWGWLKNVRDRLPGDAFGVLAHVIGADGYMPDFVTTTARWDLGPDDELAALREAPLAGMRVDLGKMVVRSSGRRQDALRRMQDDPAWARAMIADAWAEVWEAAMAPVWPQLERILRSDIAVRSRTIATEGLAAMASGIHPQVSWGDGSVRVRLRRHSEDVDCRGGGLVLVPSVMSSWGCMVITEPPAQPTLFYPARGVTAGWAADAEDLVRALEALIGPVRAGILFTAHVPRTTSRVAAEAGIAVSTASHHLTVLRDAGLIVSTRDGARMMHLRAPLGEALVGAAL